MSTALDVYANQLPESFPPCRLSGDGATDCGRVREINEDAYCVDILLQISAAQGALGKAGQVLLGQHIRTCVADAFASGDEVSRDEKVDELMDVFSRYGGLGR